MTLKIGAINDEHSLSFSPKKSFKLKRKDFKLIEKRFVVRK